MKRNSFLLIFFLAVILSLCQSALAQNDSAADPNAFDPASPEKFKIDPDDLFITDKTYLMDQTFTRKLFSATFDTLQNPVCGLVNDEYLHSVNINFDVPSQKGQAEEFIFQLKPAEKDILTSTAGTTFESAQAKDFHVHFVMTPSEIASTNDGSCWFAYSNKKVAGTGTVSGIRLTLGKSAVAYSIDGTEEKDQEIGDLSAYGETGQAYHIDIVRLDGTAYFYINGKYLFNYADGITQMVTWQAGTVLFKGGEAAKCVFDNFNVTQK